MQYVLDRDGRRVYPGDYVKCATIQYTSINKDERRRVQRIEDGNIVLINHISPYGTSPYNPRNFTIHARYQKPHMYEQKETPMLHIAIELRNNASFEDMASFLRHASSPPVILADTSQSALKERIKARLASYPDEKWLILSGNTIGERAEPPVRFRSI